MTSRCSLVFTSHYRITQRPEAAGRAEKNIVDAAREGILDVVIHLVQEKGIAVDFQESTVRLELLILSLSAIMILITAFVCFINYREAQHRS